MKRLVSVLWVCLVLICLHVSVAGAQWPEWEQLETLNLKDSGYRGIWYMNQPTNDEYVYKYSGGLGTYCAKHQPFAVFCPQAGKTFFCYGGTTSDDNSHLMHMVSYYDHRTGMVPRPRILLDKKTSDAHDNPVISVDDDGYIWIFSTAHGVNRPSWIHRSSKPYSIDSFELVRATENTDDGEKLIQNFSYMQVWHVPERGFLGFLSRYHNPVHRTIGMFSSPDGEHWSIWKRIGAIHEGHYQISVAENGTAASAFNMHPDGRGGNWRTSLYCVLAGDDGCFTSAGGSVLETPLKEPINPALIHDYRRDSLNVYLKDIRIDSEGHPVILYLTSKGWQAGPGNAPRVWTTARWDGERWVIHPAMTSDNNYDMGSLYLEQDGTWRLIAPTDVGPQPYNPGGEMQMWTSTDRGQNWKLVRNMTASSERNHTYARRPVNAHPDFYALWADGHGRQPSISNLYFCDREGNVYLLPRSMDGEFATPQKMFTGE